MIRRHQRGWLLAIFAALVVPLLWAPAAQAISKIKIREVYAGTNDDSYVELQAFADFIYAGNTLPGKSLILFDSDGDPTIRFTFVNENNLGASNTMFLIGDTGVQETFGKTADIIDPGMEIDPAAGAACWNVGDTPVDCVSWGAFTGEAKLQAYSKSKTGNAATPGGIPAGKAITRLITPNCPTWLEDEDDTDDTATDFVVDDPHPHPAGDFEFGPEFPCSSGMPDDTAIGQKPSGTANTGVAHFTYSATGATGYQCKLDNAVRFTACPSGGIEYAGLPDGTHLFQVRALNANGPDATPAVHLWTVDTQPPQGQILTAPPAQSFGRTASFTFASNEPAATFRCGLDAAPTSPCSSGIRLSSLSTGPHTFSVVAVDAGGNVQVTPASYSWMVSADPPATTIDAKPGDPTASSSATFSFHANRPDTVFECSLDGAEFSSCPTSGATYLDLTKGAHSFRVRAIDSDGVVEATPAAYSWTIAAPKKARKCRKGQRRKKVRGVVKCVKAPKPTRSQRR
jgi:hypothetical protein